jgi:hypothetical protein
MTEPILLTPGPLDHLGRHKIRHAEGLGILGRHLQPVDRLGVPRSRGHRAWGTRACLRASAGQRHFRRRSGARHARSQGGKVLVPDNGSYCKRIVRILRLSRPRGRGPAARRARAGFDLCADRRRIERGSHDYARRAGALRDRYRNLESVGGDFGRRGQTRPRLDRRRDELLRRHTHRRPHAALRCADRSLGKMSRGRTRHGLRDHPARRAGAFRRQQLGFARHGSVRPVAVPAEDRSVAIHAADPRPRRAARRHRPIPGAGWARGAAGALLRELRGAGGRHAQAWVDGRFCRTPCRRRSSSRFILRPIRRSTSRSSTAWCATADSSCIRAS